MKNDCVTQVSQQGSRGGAGAESTRLAPMWPGFNSLSGVICGLSLLVLYSAQRGFSPSTLVFPSPQKPIGFDMC